jgi:hypothetical protein
MKTHHRAYGVGNGVDGLRAAEPKDRFYEGSFVTPLLFQLFVI